MTKLSYEAPLLDEVRIFPWSVMAQSPNEVDSDITSLSSDNSDNNFFNF